MGHRDTSAKTPLIWTLSRRVIALDPDSGAKLWEFNLGSQPRRTFLHGETVLVASEETLHVLDLRDGHELEATQLGFRVSAIVAEEDRVFLAGGSGMVCMGPGRRILWSVKLEEGKWKPLSGTPRSLTCRDRDGVELWKSEADIFGSNGGLILGDAVVQPDLDT